MAYGSEARSSTALGRGLYVTPASNSQSHAGLRREIPPQVREATEESGP